MTLTQPPADAEIVYRALRERRSRITDTLEIWDHLPLRSSHPFLMETRADLAQINAAIARRICQGPYDGAGSYDPSGAYIHLFISVDGGGLHTFRASRGGAEQLLRELQVALHLDLDRLTGSVIDAYTLAPNDEEEKRDAVRAAIARGLSA